MHASSRVTRTASAFGRACAFWVLACCLLGSHPVHAQAAADVRDAVVKIYCVQNQPDYDNPWNMKGPKACNGSGCVISDRRILTNAHIVSDHTFIQVRRYGDSKKFAARLLAVSHDADLALLTVDDRSFFDGIEPLGLGNLPQLQERVTVYGFPKGGDSLSSTSGLISRIEHQSYVHSWMALLAGQIDAGINPGNSGGPVIWQNSLVGIVMQVLSDAENIGYMVPTPVIEHFLTDVKDGVCDSFPEVGVLVQSMENESLKRRYGLKPDESGALITAVYPRGSADGLLRSGDVILSIGGYRVSDDCTIEFRPKERTNLMYAVQQHQIGDIIDLKVLRSGKRVILKLALTKSRRRNGTLPVWDYDVRPSYYIYGGLVFSPLTLNYLKTWGGAAAENAPYYLLNILLEQARSPEELEPVVVIKVLSAELNAGYQDLINKRIVEVDAVKISALQDLARILEKPTDSPYVAFKTDEGHTIVLDRKRVLAEQDQILIDYSISARFSRDLFHPAAGPGSAKKQSVDSLPIDNSRLAGP